MRVLSILADTVSQLTAPEAPTKGGLSQQSIILDAIVFILGVLILGGLLVYIGKRIFLDEKE
jgi:hypothetical protein